MVGVFSEFVQVDVVRLAEGFHFLVVHAFYIYFIQSLSVNSQVLRLDGIGNFQSELRMS